MTEERRANHPPLTPIDIIRDARREIVTNRGPCQASSEWLLHVTSKRLIEESSAGPVLRRSLLEDVTRILGTHHLVDTRDSRSDRVRGTGTDG